MRKIGRRGQAMTEVVLLFPLFMFFLIAFAKVFALLILVQKLEIASFYAGRRWQLESHRNANCESFDAGALRLDIQQKVLSYLGYESATYSMNWGSSGGGSTGTSKNEGAGERTSSSSNAKFLNLSNHCMVTKECSAGRPGVTVQRTQVWNVVTVTACTNPVNFAFYKTKGFVFCSTKYVPNRDRPIAFVLPGLSGGAQQATPGCGG